MTGRNLTAETRNTLLYASCKKDWEWELCVCTSSLRSCWFMCSSQEWVIDKDLYSFLESSFSEEVYESESKNFIATGSKAIVEVMQSSGVI